MGKVEVDFLSPRSGAVKRSLTSTRRVTAVKSTNFSKKLTTHISHASILLLILFFDIKRHQRKSNEMNSNLDNQKQFEINKFDPKYFFFELPLYEEVLAKTETKRKQLLEILNFRGEFDAYNFRIKENSTYEGYSNYNSLRSELKEESIIKGVTLKCKRTDEEYKYYLLVNKDKVVKIGQYPSLADLNIGLIKEYGNVLSKEKLKEFIRGMGLRAHGVGIGSFVYLRRIFEYLIEQEHLKAKQELSWDADLYQKSRMIEKIDLLKNYLPNFLVENKDLYGILSLGIHELSEEECLEYFDALKIGIQEILDEKVIELQRQSRRKFAEKSIDNVRRVLKSKN
jgi:hypothetical protein